MKLKFFLVIYLFLFWGGLCYSQNAPKTKLNDGLYQITKIDTVATELSALKPNEIAISFSKIFEEYNTGEFIRLIIDSSDFVPLELEKTPSTEQQTENKKKLLLSLSKEASEKLKIFSAKHIMDQVAIVVDGEALTTHKIREAITSGQLQITRCNDNACEFLYIKLKNNVKK